MPSAARTVLHAIAYSGCALLAILTIPQNSPSMLWKWPSPPFLQLMLALPALWLLVSAFASPTRHAGLGTAPLIATVGLIVSAVVSSLAGPFPRFSAEFLPLGIGPLFLLLAIARATADPKGGESKALLVARTIGGALGGLCALSFLWWLLVDIFGAWLQPDGRTFSQVLAIRNDHPLGHSNYTGGMAVLALGWTGGLACLTQGQGRRIWTVGAAFALAALLSSGSRGALLGLATLGGIAAWFYLVRRGANRRRIFFGVAIVALATVALAIAHPRTRALFENLQETGRLNHGDVQRYSMAQAALRMAAENPLLGHGPGATPLAYPAFRSELAGGVESALQLHSTPLQIVADTGLLGLAAAIAIAILVLLRLRIESRAPVFTVSGCASIAFAGYAAYSVTDFQLDVPFIGATVAATAALALRTATSRRVPAALVIVLAAGWIALVAWTQRGPLMERARFSDAIDALEKRDFAGFKSIVHGDNVTTEFSFPILNSIALIVADPTAYGVEAPSDPAAATELLRVSLVQNPDQEIAHFNLGWLLLQSNPADAERHFTETARLVPDKGGVYLGLSQALLAQGRRDQAGVAVAAEMVNDPAFCASPLWNLPSFAPARESILGVAAMQLESIAPGDGRASRVASVFRWLAGDEPESGQAGPVPGFGREAFAPPIEAAIGVRRQRTAYPLLMRNADIPPPVDLWSVVEHPRAQTLLREVFPPKGWLSGPELSKLLAPDAGH